MANGETVGVSGIRSDRTTGSMPFTVDDAEYLDDVIIDASASRDYFNTSYTDTLRAGNLIRKSSGLWVPALLGVTNGAYDDDGAAGGGASEDTNLVVTAATAQMVEKTIGSTGTLYILGAASGPAAVSDVAVHSEAFTAVNTSTGAITLSASVGADLVDGSLILGFLPVLPGAASSLITEDFAIIDKADGVKVTDDDGNEVDTFLAEAAVGGRCDVSQLKNWPSDTELAAVLQYNLSQVMPRMSFE